jgi:hypothetical protein
VMPLSLVRLKVGGENVKIFKDNVTKKRKGLDYRRIWK